MKLICLSLVCMSLNAGSKIPQIAAYTTIAVNADTIVKSIRHPVKTVKTVSKKVKSTVKGK